MAEFSPKFKEALSLVQKPGRYTGGEPGSVYKDKDKVDVRMAFCFPDTYEIGMSFLGEKILYDILNRHENWWCERAFMPWTDMIEERKRNIVLQYFFIGDTDTYIGKMLDCSRANVTKCRIQALDKLKQLIEEEKEKCQKS